MCKCNAPISNVDDVVPLPLDSFVQKPFKPRDPRFTESCPHLFWFYIGVAWFPLVLDRACKRWVEQVSDVSMCICDIEVFRASVALCDAWRTCVV